MCFYPQFDCWDDHGCGEWNDHSHHMPPLVGAKISPTSIVICVIVNIIIVMIIVIVILIIVIMIIAVMTIQTICHR